MRVYLDSVIVIYLVEGLPSFQARAQATLAAVATYSLSSGVRLYF